MDDLISRQAAIDAIRASTSKYTGFMEMEMYTDDDAVEAIEALPPVQPEKRTDKRTETHACDCISRQAAMDAFAEYVKRSNNSDFAPTPTWNDAVKIIEQLPSAQPERKKGKWKMDIKRHVFVCSICGAWQVFNCNYCSSCGADMREVDDERPD